MRSLSTEANTAIAIRSSVPSAQPAPPTSPRAAGALTVRPAHANATRPTANTPRPATRSATTANTASATRSIGARSAERRGSLSHKPSPQRRPR